jgi:GNAT superfamily N-acetyltransferase
MQADAGSISIRKATPADVGELARLRWEMTDEEGNTRESRAEFAAPFAAAFDRFAASGSWIVWVAHVGDRLVGCIWLYRIERVPRPNGDARVMGYVTNVYVEPGSRNRGIGTRLLAQARELAERERMSELFVWPSDAAVTLYRRAGYRPSPEVHELELIPDL